MQIDLNYRDIISVNADTMYYGLFSLLSIVLTIGASIAMLKNITVNYQLALAVSLPSLSISVVWHFTLFWQHFVFLSLGSFYDFMRLPACGFFVLSFVFQMRLIQDIFKI